MCSAPFDSLPPPPSPLSAAELFVNSSAAAAGLTATTRDAEEEGWKLIRRKARATATAKTKTNCRSDVERLEASARTKYCINTMKYYKHVEVVWVRERSKKRGAKWICSLCHKKRLFQNPTSRTTIGDIYFSFCILTKNMLRF